jgi:enoyl-CoA hydratase/carnithine racemase
VAGYETIDFRVEDGVAWVVLNRPQALNAFDTVMQQELQRIWRGLRTDDAVRCTVLTGAGDRAFCTGIDRNEALGGGASDGGVPGGEPSGGGARTVGSRGTPFHFDDPGALIGPKSNDCWKPVVAAVNGMACGGAFYLLGEVDVIIAAEDATFFDPHVTYGMAAVFESVHMLQKMPLGEVLRMQLLGAHERLSAQRALDIGLVSEVVPAADLRAAAGRVAAIIASQPQLAVQATLRAIWTAHELTRRQALDEGFAYIAAGTSPEALAEGQRMFTSGERVEWRLR